MMTYNEVLERVIAVLSTISEAEAITEDSEIIEDLGISSMDVLFLISSMEAEFKCKISEKDMRNVVTVEDVAQIVLGAIQ